MPVGVPKVPGMMPGDEEQSWVELYQKLSRKGILFLCKEIEEEIANKIMGLMLYLSMEDHTRPLHLYINSPGGGVIQGMAIHNIIRFIPTEVNTICMGTAASIASYVLLAGTKEKRFALPHARIMIHQPSGSLKKGKKRLSNELASLYLNV
jgi:ATP-dependent Clp protease protease subunit